MLGKFLTILLVFTLLLHF